MKFFKIGQPAPPEEEYRAKPVIVTTERTVRTAVGGGAQLQAVINDKGRINVSVTKPHLDPRRGMVQLDSGIPVTLDYVTLVQFTATVGNEQRKALDEDTSENPFRTTRRS